MLNPDYIMRKMAVHDIHKVMQIEIESFTLPWSEKSYRAELDNKYANYIVCDIEGEIAGYGGIWVIFEEAHITSIAVDMKFRGNGLGKALMKELEGFARRKGAEVILLEARQTNSRALEMYKGLGYKPRGLRRAYYSDNQEDAVTMVKFI